MNIVKRIATLFLVAITLCTSIAIAVPAYPGIISYRQSDGTVIRIRVLGDEFDGRVVTEDGYTIIGKGDKNYYYAELGQNGELTASSVMVKPSSKLSKVEREYISRIPRNLTGTRSTIPLNIVAKSAAAPLASNANQSESALEAPEGILSFSSTTGDIKSLVILVEFADVKFSMADPVQAFDEMLNLEGYSYNGATGSAKDYYVAQSMGQFVPDYDVIGPIQLQYDASYYGGEYGTDRVIEMAMEACEAADPLADFSLYAENGKVRDIFIFYAGYNRAEGGAGTVWPHRYTENGIPIADRQFDGCDIMAYACTSELRGAEGTERAGIGTFCHEFGHVLGWVDLYDVNYEQEGLCRGLEYYSLMNTGPYLNAGRTPPPSNVLERWMAGWMEPTVLDTDGEYTLKSVDQNEGFLIHTDNDGEYFLIDYRDSRNTVWDNYLGNSDGSVHHKGFLITHVDASRKRKDNWNYNTVNTYSERELVKLLRSTGVESIEETMFPGGDNVTSITSETNSEYIYWSGERVMMEIFNMEAFDGEGKLTAIHYVDYGQPRLLVTPVVNDLYNVVLENAPEGSTAKYYLNGVENADGKYKISEAGIHNITVVITSASGESQQVIKYLEVK